MDKVLLSILLGLGIIVVVCLISLVMAWPVMWCWNYAVVAIWGLPKITWGMAWCLMFLAQFLIKSTLVSKN
jgi:hypothetical protein